MLQQYRCQGVVLIGFYSKSIRPGCCWCSQSRSAKGLMVTKNNSVAARITIQMRHGRRQEINTDGVGSFSTAAIQECPAGLCTYQRRSFWGHGGFWSDLDSDVPRPLPYAFSIECRRSICSFSIVPRTQSPGYAKTDQNKLTEAAACVSSLCIKPWVFFNRWILSE